MDYSVSPSPFPLDFRFRIWDLDLELDLGLTILTPAAGSKMPLMTMTEAPEYFFLYRISYAWTSAIGFMVTILVGIIMGELVRLVWPEETPVEPALLATSLRPRQARNRELRELREQVRLPRLSSDIKGVN